MSTLSVPGDRDDFPGNSRKVTVVIGTDGERVTVLAKTDDSHRWRECDDAHLAPHTSDVRRQLLDLGFVPSGPWKQSPDPALAERCYTRWRGSP